MRAMLVVIGGLALAPGVATAQSLGQLVGYCEQLESFWRQNPALQGGVSLPLQAEPAVCYGYIAAMTQLDHMVEGDCSKGIGPTCHFILHFCAPPDVSSNQMLAVFLAYARNKPAAWHEQASIHYLNAMRQAFPCKAE
jgi:hypothetical protein